MTGLGANNEDAYVVPSVKVEAGAKSAVNPSLTCSIQPYVDCELNELSLDVRNIRTIIPERTYLDKILIFHGLHCRYRDEQRLPNENARISRHYYDVAVITKTEVGNLLCQMKNCWKMLGTTTASLFEADGNDWKKLFPGR